MFGCKFVNKALDCCVTNDVDGNAEDERFYELLSSLEEIESVL